MESFAGWAVFDWGILSISQISPPPQCYTANSFWIFGKFWKSCWVSTNPSSYFYFILSSWPEITHGAYIVHTSKMYLCVCTVHQRWLKCVMTLQLSRNMICCILLWNTIGVALYYCFNYPFHSIQGWCLKVRGRWHYKVWDLHCQALWNECWLLKP